MLDLFMQYLDIIVAGVFTLAFLARFITAKRVAGKLAKLVQSYHAGAKDKKWTAVEYEAFGRTAVPVIKEVEEILRGITWFKSKI